ncbi:conserved hypothetical protein, secreted [Candidatus Magnetomorum sp. HK-1]|nr:conserved hypothetical protein, secreted [Candidatus Magnetomorum sp. HK-1]
MLLHNKNKLIKRLFIVAMLTVFSFNINLNDAEALDYFMPVSTPNTVGPGARAHGMGGAFMVVADDGTSAYWNTACLNNLINKEFSLVTDFTHRIENNDFKTNPTETDLQTVSQLDLNHISYSQPFSSKLFYIFPKAHHVLSINFLKQYSFSQKWDFIRKIQSNDIMVYDDIDYKCEGKLSTIGIAYSLMIRENISIGIMLNIWNSSVTNNQWEKTSYQECIRNNKIIEQALANETYDFNGYNANLGLLWQNIFNSDGLYKINLGFILKTPFNADIDRTYSLVTSNGYKEVVKKQEVMKMPVSYGIGTALVSNDFNYALDMYYTKWNDFCDTNPTLVIRMGTEYLYKRNNYVIPFRSGLYYDETPAKGTTDIYYGITLGTGIEFIDKYAFDVAYQFRYANNVGSSILESMGFSQDVREHTIYTSMIIYF